MEQNTTDTAYRYVAGNEESYNRLAAYAMTLVANVYAYPGQMTIIIDGSAAREAGEYIDDMGLDFHISPVEVDSDNLEDVIAAETADPGTLCSVIGRLLAEKEKMTAEYDKGCLESAQEQIRLRNALKQTETDRDMYKRWYEEASARTERIENQCKAISVLMDSISHADR